MSLKDSLKTGIGFGITSSIITTLGLMVGLFAGTESRLAVIGGIISIAIVDAFSDALAIHVSEESKHKTSKKEVQESTASAFVAKFIFAIIFLPAVIFMDLATAVISNIVLGMAILAAYSYYVAKEKGDSIMHTISEHVVVGLAVIIITFFVGEWVAITFK